MKKKYNDKSELKINRKQLFVREFSRAMRWCRTRFTNYQVMVVHAFFLMFVSILISFSLRAEEYADKRVLFIDSYHQGYAWSDGVVRGVEQVLIPTGINLLIHRMDTKRNRTESFIHEAARQVKDKIISFAPDVVIISDDNAVKHVLQKYYRNAELPFVFCGVKFWFFCFLFVSQKFFKNGSSPLLTVFAGWKKETLKPVYPRRCRMRSVQFSRASMP